MFKTPSCYGMSCHGYKCFFQSPLVDRAKRCIVNGSRFVKFLVAPNHHISLWVVKLQSPNSFLFISMFKNVGLLASFHNELQQIGLVVGPISKHGNFYIGTFTKTS